MDRRVLALITREKEAVDLSERLSEIEEETKQLLIDLYGDADWKHISAEIRKLWKDQRTLKYFLSRLDSLFGQFRLDFSVGQFSVNDILDLIHDLTPKSVHHTTTGLKGFTLDVSTYYREKITPVYYFCMCMSKDEVRSLFPGVVITDEMFLQSKPNSKTLFAMNNKKTIEIFKQYNKLIQANKPNDMKVIKDDYYVKACEDLCVVSFTVTPRSPDSSNVTEFNFSIHLVASTNHSPLLLLQTLTFTTSNAKNQFLSWYYLLEWRYSNQNVIFAQSKYAPGKGPAPKLDSVKAYPFNISYAIRLDTSELHPTPSDLRYSYDYTVSSLKLHNHTSTFYTQDDVPWAPLILLDDELPLPIIPLASLPVSFFFKVDDPGSRLRNPANWSVSKLNELQIEFETFTSSLEIKAQILSLFRYASVIETAVKVDEELLVADGQNGLLPAIVDGVTGVVQDMSKVMRSAVLYHNVNIKLDSPSKWVTIPVFFYTYSGELYSEKWEPGDRPDENSVSFNAVIHVEKYPHDIYKERYNCKVLMGDEPLAPVLHTGILYENDDIMVVAEITVVPVVLKIEGRAGGREPFLNLNMSDFGSGFFNKKNCPLEYKRTKYIPEPYPELAILPTTETPKVVNSKLYVLSKNSITAVTPSVLGVNKITLKHVGLSISDEALINCVDWNPIELTFVDGRKYYGIVSNLPIKPVSPKFAQGVSMRGRSQIPSSLQSGPLDVKLDVTQFGDITAGIGSGSYSITNQSGTLSANIDVSVNISRHVVITGVDYTITMDIKTTVPRDVYDSGPYISFSNNLPILDMSQIVSDQPRVFDPLATDEIKSGKHVYALFLNSVSFQIQNMEINLSVSTSFGGGGAISSWSDRLMMMGFTQGLLSDTVDNLKKRVTNLELRVSMIEKYIEEQQLMQLISLGIDILQVTGIGGAILSAVAKMATLSLGKFVRIAYFIVQASLGPLLSDFLFVYRFASYTINKIYEYIANTIAEARLLLQVLKKRAKYDLIKAEKRFTDVYLQDSRYIAMDPTEMMKFNIDGLTGFGKRALSVVDDQPIMRLADAHSSCALFSTLGQSSMGEVSVYVRPLGCLPSDVGRFLNDFSLDGLNSTDPHDVLKWLKWQRHPVHTYMVADTMSVFKGQTYIERSFIGIGEANKAGKMGGDFKANVASYSIKYKVSARDSLDKWIMEPIPLADSGWSSAEVRGLARTLFKKDLDATDEELWSLIYTHSGLRVMGERKLTSVPMSLSRIAALDVITKDLCDSEWGYRVGVNVFMSPNNCQTLVFKLLDWVCGGPLPDFVSQDTRIKLFQRQISFLGDVWDDDEPILPPNPKLLRSKRSTPNYSSIPAISRNVYLGDKVVLITEHPESIRLISKKDYDSHARDLPLDQHPKLLTSELDLLGWLQTHYDLCKKGLDFDAKVQLFDAVMEDIYTRYSVPVHPNSILEFYLHRYRELL